MKSSTQPRRVSKDELNLIEFPFSLPCHRHPKNRTTIHIAEESLDQEGRPVAREWTVRAMNGLPLAIDEEVYLGAMHLLQQAGFKERHLHFTQYSFLQLLGWGTGNREYQRLKQSLDRLRGVIIESKGTFWDHRGKCRVTRNFNLLDEYVLYERDQATASDQPFISRLSFSEFIFESFQAGFIKTLDLDFYLSLKLPIARKLFRYLDKQAYQGNVFETDLARLAQKLAITDSAYLSKIKQHLDPSHKELLSLGFLKSANYLRRGRAPSVRYLIAAREEWVRREVTVPKVAAAACQRHPLAKELIARGITPGVADDLVKTCDEKSVADKLEVFDYLRQEQSPAIAKNPAGFLRQSIEKDFAPPAGYVSRAERQRRKEEEKATRQRQADEARAVEVELLERKEYFETLWSSLDDSERTRLEEEALQRINSFALKLYTKEKEAGRSGSGHQTLRNEIEQLLAARQKHESQPGSTVVVS